MYLCIFFTCELSNLCKDTKHKSKTTVEDQSGHSLHFLMGYSVCSLHVTCKEMGTLSNKLN